MITYDEFKKVEIRAGKILSAEKIPDTDKLLKLSVDFGETEEVKAITETNSDATIKIENSAEGIVAVVPGEITKNENETSTSSTTPKEFKKMISKPRQIVSGIALKFPDVASLVGRTCMFVTNLEPRMIKGYESNGMLFAVSTPEGGFSLLEPNETIPPGTMAV